MRHLSVRHFIANTFFILIFLLTISYPRPTYAQGFACIPNSCSSQRGICDSGGAEFCNSFCGAASVCSTLNCGSGGYFTCTVPTSTPIPSPTPVCTPGAVNAGCSGTCNTYTSSCSYTNGGDYFSQTCVADGSGWTTPVNSCNLSCSGYCPLPTNTPTPTPIPCTYTPNSNECTACNQRTYYGCYAAIDSRFDTTCSWLCTPTSTPIPPTSAPTATPAPTAPPSNPCSGWSLCTGAAGDPVGSCTDSNGNTCTQFSVWKCSFNGEDYCDNDDPNACDEPCQAPTPTSIGCYNCPNYNDTNTCGGNPTLACHFVSTQPNCSDGGAWDLSSTIAGCRGSCSPSTCNPTPTPTSTGGGGPPGGGNPTQPPGGGNPTPTPNTSDPCYEAGVAGTTGRGAGACCSASSQCSSSCCIGGSCANEIVCTGPTPLPPVGTKGCGQGCAGSYQGCDVDLGNVTIDGTNYTRLTCVGEGLAQYLNSNDWPGCAYGECKDKCWEPCIANGNQCGGDHCSCCPGSQCVNGTCQPICTPTCNNSQAGNYNCGQRFTYGDGCGGTCTNGVGAKCPNGGTCNTQTNSCNVTITGNVFIDINRNGRKDSGESNYAGSITITSTQGTVTTTNSGTYTVSLPIDTGTVVSYTSIPTGYSMTHPVNGPPPSFSVTVGSSCQTGGSNDASCNNGSIVNLNFAMTNLFPWFQGKAGDMRLDNGFLDNLPNGQYVSVKGPALSGQQGSPGVVYTGNVSASLGKGQASENPDNWIAGGITYSEVFSPKTPGVIKTSYDYMRTIILQNGITPIDLSSLDTCRDVGNCTLPASLASGVYQANSLVRLNTYTFPTDKHYVFLIDGDLHIYGNLLVPNGSTVTFIAKGNILVWNTVGAPLVTTVCAPATMAGSVSTGCQIEGLYSADKSFIVQQAGTPTDPCNTNSTPKDKRLNIAGAVVANAELNFSSGRFENQRDLCNQNSEPTVTFTERPDLLLNAPSYIKYQSFTWQEIAP